MQDKRRPGRPEHKKPWTFNDWYAKNKQTLSERRKKRYATDQAYRDLVITRNKAYRDKHRQEWPVKLRRPKTINVNMNGQDVSVIAFNIGFMANSLGKTAATVRGWEKSGILPRTPFTVGGKSERVYTEEMISAVKAVLDSRHGQVNKGDILFYNEIVDRWRAIGVHLDG